MPFLATESGGLFYDATGSGPLALFVHGGGLDHTMWRHQLDGLADLRHCVAIDLPGSGRSAPGKLDLSSVIAALGEPQGDLVGHSWGGHEVLAAWRSHPERIRSIALVGVMFSVDAPPREPPQALTGRAVPGRPVPIAAQVETVASITVPFLVAAGEADVNTPAPMCRKFAAANLGARFVEITGAGHMAPLEQPQQVNSALRDLWYPQFQNAVPLQGT